MKTYEISNQTQVMLDKAFLMHPPSQDQSDRKEHIRARIEAITRQVAALVPDCNEQRELIRCMREAIFWGHEAIAKNEIGGR